MEVDPCPSTSAEQLSPKAILPKIDEDNVLDFPHPKEKIMEILDNLEGHVEKLRKDASKLEEEKDNILSSLDTVKLHPSLNDLIGLEKDEALRYLDRIATRCMTVDVKVFTQRDKSQEEALHQVNHLIDNLVVCLKTDPDGAKNRCLTYMNSCSSQLNGLTDKHFESVLLGCTIDDQKKVKKRLHGLLRYFDKMGFAIEVD
ncbi:PREDICTED: BAG family molecular chaperone regulator 2 [Nicrophorus vespilloides]|uniref:BAG family molecular chaperone regulator 2 n=1 Tax=Nicrophorus vespilloides TaxID=110193 RepID=A0ABM1MIZ8_NICVS|nr:PREDICTED: BAG family molecular chaperone regulator 2 [Nicrophorus vespilloides]